MTRQRTGLRCWSSSLSDSFRPKKEDPHRSGGGLPFSSLADRGRTSRRVSRILSCDTEVPSGDHPSGHTVAGCLERFTRRLGRAALEHLRSRTAGDATFNLAPGGVYLATPVTRGAGALLPHRFTLTCLERQAVCFLWHCPASCLGLPLTTALLCGVRTFLGPRPVRGTRWFQKPRPPGQLVRPRMLPGACRWSALWSPYDSVRGPATRYQRGRHQHQDGGPGESLR